MARQTCGGRLMSNLTPRSNRFEQNYLINGALDLRQRSAGGQAIDATQTYRVHDRFIAYVNNVSFFNSSAQGPTNLTDSDGVSWQAININCDASDSQAEAYIVQRIEAENVKPLLSNGKMSLSFLLRNNNFTTVAARFYYPNTTDDYSGGQTAFHTTADQVFTADTTAKEVKFENIDVPAAAEAGIAVEIIYKGFTLSTADDTAITKLMLNAGEFSVPFTRAGGDVTMEEVLCKKYCWQPRAREMFGAGFWENSGFVRVSFKFPIRMRAIPTFTGITPGDMIASRRGSSNISAGTLSINTIGPGGVDMDYPTVTGLSIAGDGCVAFNNTDNAVRFDAEL